MRIIVAILALVALGFAAFALITRPAVTDPAEMEGLTGEAARGEMVFWAGGCASCHAVPGATGDDRLVLAGGLALQTAFGTFSVPNISPDPDHGIGDWTALDLDNAMRHGTSPGDQHYYPAFPYTSYANATHQDVADLWAFLQTLPPSDRPNDPHDLGFPFNQRILLGGWKFLNPAGGWVVDGPLSPEEERGRALVEGLGHCGECHTPRDALGGRDLSRWLAGGPNPEGKGQIPNVTPAHLTWTPDEVAEYLSTGFTPDYDSAGGQMADVIENISHLPDSDRSAIAAYLAKVPPVE